MCSSAQEVLLRHIPLTSTAAPVHQWCMRGDCASMVHESKEWGILDEYSALNALGVPWRRRTTATTAR